MRPGLITPGQQCFFYGVGDLNYLAVGQLLVFSPGSELIGCAVNDADFASGKRGSWYSSPK